MMKIEAQSRLVQASSQKALLKFLSSKSQEEVEWFYNELPTLFDKWFNASISKKTKHLPVHFATRIAAAEYSAVDAMAIAMGHLKKIYDPKIKKPLYRSILMNKAEARTPTKEVVNFSSQPKWGAMQSWTYLKEPVIGDRSVNPKKQFELVLELSAKDAEKHVVTDYLQLGRMAKDAIDLESALEKLFPEAAFNPTRWKVLMREILTFSDEEEVFLYVPTGTSLKCRWKAREGDEYGEPLPWGFKSKGPVAPKAIAPKTAIEYFKTAGQPFKYEGAACITTGKVKGSAVQGISAVALRRAVENDTNKGLKALKPVSMTLSNCVPMPDKKFKPEVIGYFNRWLKLNP